MSWWDDTGTAARPPEDGQQVMPLPGNAAPQRDDDKHPRLLVTAALALAGVIMLAGGIGALLLLRGPEKLSMGDYAEGMCVEAIAPIAKQREHLYKSSEFEQRIMEKDVETEQDAQEAIDLTEHKLDLIVKTLASMGDFKDGHVVHGPEGEELQQDLRDYLGNATRVLETARGAWARSTPPASRTCRKS